MNDALCPCGSGQPYSHCCGRFHSGAETAPTAEALMRSRYCAFVREDADYLYRTLHPYHRDSNEKENIRASFGGISWEGLAIVAQESGQPVDNSGSVEFIAQYRHNGRVGRLHENSQFKKEDGQWFYTSGETRNLPEPGRNDPCWCGSGKKFKKCHG